MSDRLGDGATGTDSAGAPPDEQAATTAGHRSARRRTLAYLAVLGPGLIAASAGNDAGGIATYASAGSEFIYRMLFVMVLVGIALVLVQEMAARLGAFTGKGLAALVREEFSLRMAGFAIVCILIANVGLVVSEFAGIGAAMELFGVSKFIAIPISAVLIWGLVVFGSYRYAERLFLLLTVVFFAYPLAAILAHPDWQTVLTQTVWPHLEATHTFVLLTVALIGTTISPYMQLYQAAAVADKGIGPAEWSVERVDAIGGAIFAIGVAFFIIVATGAVIGGTGPLPSASAAAKALQPVAGSGAEVLFGLGLLGASALAAAVVPLSTAYALSEAIGVERSVSRTFTEAPLFLGLFTGQIVIGAAVSLVASNLISLLVNVYVLNGVITPVVLAFILALTNRRRLLGDAVNRPAFRVAATICVVVVSIMSATVVVLQVQSWLVG